MARKLAVVAFTGLAIAVVSLGAVAAIGADQIHDPDFDFGIFGGAQCSRDDNGATQRDIAWDGSDQVVLSVPANARYMPGNDDRLHVSGDPAVIGHVRVRDGHIGLDCHNWHSDMRRIDITLPGRTFRKFAVSGSGKLILDDLNQDRLKLSISGSGNIRGTGRVADLDVHISGSGHIDAGAVSSQSTRVHISGSGDADIAPKTDADIHVSGSGNVNLHSYPARMDSHISGSGRIRNMENGI